MTQPRLLTDAQRTGNRKVMVITAILAVVLALVAMAVSLLPSSASSETSPDPILIGSLDPQSMGPDEESKAASLSALDKATPQAAASYDCDSPELLTPDQREAQRQYVDSHRFLKLSDYSLVYTPGPALTVVFYTDTCTFMVPSSADVVFFDAQARIDPDSGAGELPREWFDADQQCISPVPPDTDNADEPVSAWCAVDPAA